MFFFVVVVLLPLAVQSWKSNWFQEVNLGAVQRLLLIVLQVRSRFPKEWSPRKFAKFFVTTGHDIGINKKEKQLLDKSKLMGTRIPTHAPSSENTP